MHIYFANYNYIHNSEIHLHPEVREMAMQEVELVQKGQNVDDLIHTLRNGNINGVLEAAKELGDMGGKAVGPLMPLLRDEDPRVRWRAAIAFQWIGTPAATPLIRALEEEEHYVRPPAIWVLEQIGDPRAVEPLMRAISAKHPWTRWMAMAALIKIGDPKGVAAAREAMKSEDEVARGIIEELVERS
jgi:HEAT repeat protein